jgi:hypothetical protein
VIIVSSYSVLTGPNNGMSVEAICIRHLNFAIEKRGNASKMKGVKKFVMEACLIYIENVMNSFHKLGVAMKWWELEDD